MDEERTLQRFIFLKVAHGFEGNSEVSFGGSSGGYLERWIANPQIFPLPLGDVCFDREDVWTSREKTIGR
jgi:hypothetical protein